MFGVLENQVVVMVMEKTFDYETHLEQLSQYAAEYINNWPLNTISDVLTSSESTQCRKHGALKDTTSDHQAPLPPPPGIKGDTRTHTCILTLIQSVRNTSKEERDI